MKNLSQNILVNLNSRFLIVVMSIGIAVMLSIIVVNVRRYQEAKFSLNSTDVARTTISSIENSPEKLKPQTLQLEPVVIDGVDFHRKVTLSQASEGLLELRCSITADGQEELFVKKILDKEFRDALTQ